MRTVAIIVSGGKGKRFQSKTPKQYIEIDDKPILYYALSAFNSSPWIDGIVLVLDKTEQYKKLIKKYDLKKIFKVVKGGLTRADSVYNGLMAVPSGTGIVVIHDGVRPLVKQDLIKKVIDGARKYGAAISAVSAKDTIKEVSGDLFVKRTLNRKDLIVVQTPQAFRYKMFKDCYTHVHPAGGHKGLDITDDSRLAEMAGHKVKVVKGGRDNIKITTKEDLDFAKAQLARCGALKAGVGYDIHRLVKGRRLILGGVRIPNKCGLLGHSDADVLLHAVTDAILGSIGERDIGWHFSNKDNRFKGIASSFFLIEAKKMLRKKGYIIQNIDSIIIAQEPKLQPYYSKMVKNISAWLGISEDDVTVKFTTPEETGPLGNKEAIAGMAIVTVAK